MGARAAGAAAIIAALAYLAWRTTTLGTSAWLSIPLFLVELWGVGHLALLVMQGWSVPGRSVDAPLNEAPLVTTIVTATFHSPEDLERTLIGCRAMDSDGRVVVAVREGRDDLVEVCRSFDVDQLHGTGNHVDLFWLAVEASGASVAAWLEAGQVPMPDFVTALGGELAEGVAVVQGAIGLLNKDSLAHLEGGRDEDAFRREVAYPSMSAQGGAPWFGGGSLVRVHAIEDSGGLDRSDQAALQRSLVRLHTAGWRSRYLSSAVLRATAPDSLETYLHRRRRSVVETLRVFRTPENPLTTSGLPARHRLGHLALATAYTTGIRQLALVAILVITLVTGTVPVGDDVLTWAAVWTPSFALGVLARRSLARGSMRVGDWTRQGWRTAGADLSAFAGMYGVGRHRAFAESSTTGVRALGELRLLTAVLLVVDLALVARGLTMVWPRLLPRFSASGRVVALLLGLVVVVGIIDVLQVAVRRRQRRAQYRLATDLVAFMGHERGDVIDLAPTGAGVHLPPGTSVAIDDEVTLRLALPSARGREIVALPAVVRSLVSMDDRLRVGLAFGDLDREARAALVEYCAIEHHRDGATAHRTQPGDFEAHAQGLATRGVSGTAVALGVGALFFGPAALPALADVAAPATACLTTSTGAALEGGEVRFHYDGSWHDVGRTGADGCVSGDMPARRTLVSVTHGGVQNSVRQDLAVDPVVVFATVPVSVVLTSSVGEPIAGGLVEVHTGGWREVGVTGVEGLVSFEMLASRRTFRVTHGGVANSVKQDVAVDPVVVFATVPVSVVLTSSVGEPIAGGLVEVHTGGWREVGVTGVEGLVSFEMLASRRTFRVTHGGVANSVKQDVAVDPVVVFATVPVSVVLTSSVGEPIAGGLVEVHTGGWREVGVTGVEGLVSFEMLASRRTFRVTHGGVANSVKQDVAVDPVVVFATVPVSVVLTSSVGEPIAGGLVEVHTGGWREVGVTGVEGLVSFEMLASRRTFRVTHDGVANSVKQDVAVDPVVVFATVPVSVVLTSSVGEPIAGGLVEVHTGGWREVGVTGVEGLVSFEMLASRRTFRVTHDGVRVNQRATVPDEDVVFRTVAVVADEGVDIERYRAGTLRPFSDGIEVLPGRIEFRLADGTRERVNLTAGAVNSVPSGRTVPPSEPEAAPTVEPTPEPTATPEPTPAPGDGVPVATPQVVAAPTPEPTPEPTATPEPTPEPTSKPTATPEPTVTPGLVIDLGDGVPQTSEPTPEPTVTPGLVIDLGDGVPQTSEPTPTSEPTTAPTATPEPTPTAVELDEQADDETTDEGRLAVPNRTIILSPGVDWNAADPAVNEQLELRLTEPDVAAPDLGFAISVENLSAATLTEPIVVEVAVPRTTGVRLDEDAGGWSCAAVDDLAFECAHPGGLPAASTSVLAFDPGPAVVGELRYQPASHTRDVVIAVAGLLAVALVITGSRRVPALFVRRR